MKDKKLGEMGLKSYEHGYFNKANANLGGEIRQMYSIRIRKELRDFAKENKCYGGRLKKKSPTSQKFIQKMTEEISWELPSDIG